MEDGWGGLNFYQLLLNEHGFGLVNANEKYIEWGWTIPQEIRLFAHDGASNAYGIYLPVCGNWIFNHPIIEVGTITTEDGCMGVAGTNLISFLRGWSAYDLMEHEIDGRSRVRGWHKDAPNRLKRDTDRTGHAYRFQNRLGLNIIMRILMRILPNCRKWADPQLPNPSGNSYNQRVHHYADLKRVVR